jgi:hypothetical protein
VWAIPFTIKENAILLLPPALRRARPKMPAALGCANLWLTAALAVPAVDLRC